MEYQGEILILKTKIRMSPDAADTAIAISVSPIWVIRVDELRREGNWFQGVTRRTYIRRKFVEMLALIV